MSDTAGRIFQIDEVAQVRNLIGEYIVRARFRVAGRLRYRLDGLPKTGAMLNETEAYGEDMRYIRTYAPTITDAPQEPEPLPEADPRSDAEPVPSDASEAPLTFGAASDPGYTLDAGAFGGEPDEFAPGPIAPRASGSRLPIRLTFAVDLPLIEIRYQGNSVCVEFTWS